MKRVIAFTIFFYLCITSLSWAVCIQGNCYNGKGTHTWVDGKRYVGEWRNQQPNGQGTLTWASGNKYVGEFKDGVPNGQGTHIWVDGDKYVGELKDWKMNGLGTYTWSDGQKHIGEFKDDVANGQGTRIWANGEYYVGEFKDWKMNGLGTYTWSDGRKQQGIWVNDFCSGCKIYAANELNEGTFKVASGSGFYVSKEGHVVTNNHVIEGCLNVKIFTKGKLINTDVIASDRRNDLALLKAKVNPTYVFPSKFRYSLWHTGSSSGRLPLWK